MQQDANECYTELVRCLQQRLPLPPSQRPTDSSNNVAVASQKWVDVFMRGEQECVLKNSEDENEEPSISTESFLQISCFIDSGNGEDFVFRGVVLKLAIAAFQKRNTFTPEFGTVLKAP